MQHSTKIVLGGVLSIGMLALAVFIDDAVRSRSGGPIEIDGLPIGNATVTGVWKPDFLWHGKAWKLDVQSEEDLELKLDGQIYVVPSGSHTIYSNHDHTNTGQYGREDFWGYPEDVEIRLLTRTNLTSF